MLPILVNVVIAQPICSDTDGLNPNILGKVIYRNKIYIDYCASKTTLRENYCTTRDVRTTKTIKCIAKEGCFNGVCIPKEQIPPDCIDIDGNDKSTKGITTYKGMEYTDACIGKNRVKEYYCSNDIIYSNKLLCDNTCSDGACFNSLVKKPDVDVSLFKTKYPTFHVADIADIYDFRNKCIIGYCNTKDNARSVYCVNNDMSVNLEVYYCDKIERIETEPISLYNFICSNGRLTDIYGREFGRCKKPKVINFYFMYESEKPNPNWKPTAEQMGIKLNNYFSKFNLIFIFNYYEYKIFPTENGLVTKTHPAYKDGDIHISLLNREYKQSFVGWGGLYSYKSDNPYGAMAIYLPDSKISQGETPYYYDILFHEFSHALGCLHPGDSRSLAPNIKYLGDLSGYSNIRKDFLSECRITMQSLGLSSDNYILPTTTSTTSTTTTTIPNSIITSCNDSDGGFNKVIRGTVRDDTNGVSETDLCVPYQPKKLGEYWCTSNRIILTITECPNVCSNGACT